MELLFLGTAAAEGWPAVFCRCEACRRAKAAGGKNIRTRASLLVDGIFKFDLGPDTYHQALTYGLDLGLVRHVLITHTHTDHFYPAELEMRRPPFAYPAPGESDPGLDIYGNAEVLKVSLQADTGVSAENPADPGRPVRVHTVTAFRPFGVGDAEAVALRADHKQDEEALFYLFRRHGKTILYALDTGYFPDETWAWLESPEGREWIGVTPSGGIDLAILDCTGGPLNSGRRGHMNIDVNLEVRARLIEAGLTAPHCRFVATHFSHNGKLLHDELLANFRERAVAHGQPADAFSVAYDGLRLTI